jgi:ribosome-associated protein
MASIVSKKNLPAKEKADLIRELADDIKAESITVMDVRPKTSVTSFFVICTGTSQVHVNAIADNVYQKLRKNGIKTVRAPSIAGNDGWLLYDYGDVILHVMLEEKRQFYDLETLWETTPDNPDLIV